MKNTHKLFLGILFVAAGLLCGCGDSAKPSQPVSNDFFLSYSFNETSGITVVDQSGNSNNGTLFSASRVPGKIGNGVAFPLSTSRVNIAQPVKSFNGIMTIECWFKVPSISTLSDYAILANYNFHELSLEIYNGKVSLFWDLTEYVNSTTTIVADTWYYLVVTSDGTDIKLYLNGVEENSVNLSLPGDFSVLGYIIGSRRVYSGGSSDVYQDSFTGTIDEFKWRKIALSPAEILDNYNNSK